MKIPKEIVDKSPILSMFRKARNTKNKREVLNKLLAERKIFYKVEYRWNYFGKPGWYILDGTNQRLGHNFFLAKELIESGAIDFIAEEMK